MMPRVWNSRDPRKPTGAVYVGRGTPWGNPFVLGKHGDRAEVCDRFEREVLPTLDVTPLVGRDLVCWCAPKRCHADALLQKAASLNQGASCAGPREVLEEARATLAFLDDDALENYSHVSGAEARKWIVDKIDAALQAMSRPIPKDDAVTDAMVDEGVRAVASTLILVGCSLTLEQVEQICRESYAAMSAARLEPRHDD